MEILRFRKTPQKGDVIRTWDSPHKFGTVVDIIIDEVIVNRFTVQAEIAVLQECDIVDSLNDIDFFFDPERVRFI